MTEIIARRQFVPLYMWLDTIFLIVFAVMLVANKKYMTLLVGIAAGVLYMIVDYGIFHLLLGTRSISDGNNLFGVLLWMSMSYGFTNFVWIWLWLSKDKNLREWMLLILAWWFCCPMIAETFGGNATPIVIQRTTGSYHGWMAFILFVGYFLVVLWNLNHEKREERMNIGWLLAIGILVQLGWETALLLGGIRSAGFTSWGDKFLTLVTNSLLETNLGIPYTYALYLFYASRRTETFQKREKKLSFRQALVENNSK